MSSTFCGHAPLLTAGCLQLPHVGIHDNTVIVLDNAAVHHKNEDRLKAILEDKNPNAYLEFLPPYSPILNPVRSTANFCRLRRTCNVYAYRLPHGSPWQATSPNHPAC